MNRSEKEPFDKDRETGKGGLGDNPWKAAGLVGSVGGTLGLCLGLGYWLGARADAALGTGHWSVTGMAAGLVVGILSAILLIRAFTGGKAN
jgi:hypothetical protein